MNVSAVRTPTFVRVLVVEDDEPLRALIARGLAEDGHVIDTLPDGRECDAYLAATPYDALVLDLNLPHEDGLSILRRLRARGEATPVLLLTARDATDDVVAGLNAGADDYLRKPFAFIELEARLRSIARRPPTWSGDLLQASDLTFDCSTRQARRGERDLDPHGEGSGVSRSAAAQSRPHRPAARARRSALGPGQRSILERARRVRAANTQQTRLRRRTAADRHRSRRRLPFGVDVSVRDRLARTVAIAILAAVTLFATLSIIGIDRALRSGFDERLMTMAQAMATAVDVHHGKLSVDAGDLVELQTLHAGAPFAILNASDVVIAGEPLPSQQTGGLHFARAPVLRKGLAYGTVVVWEPDLWIRDFDRTAALISLAVGIALVALGTLAARRAATVALAPLERLASLAERIEARDLSSRLRADGDDELGRLCASFDRMLDRLEGAFSRERRFVADASHELRAPLAVLRAETELALRRERTTEEYRAALDSIAREAHASGGADRRTARRGALRRRRAFARVGKRKRPAR